MLVSAGMLCTLGHFLMRRQCPFTQSDYKPTTSSFHFRIWPSAWIHRRREQGQQQWPQGTFISGQICSMTNYYIYCVYIFLMPYWHVCVVTQSRGVWGEMLEKRGDWAEQVRTAAQQENTLQFNQCVSYIFHSSIIHSEDCKPLTALFTRKWFSQKSAVALYRRRDSVMEKKILIFLLSLGRCVHRELYPFSTRKPHCS